MREERDLGVGGADDSATIEEPIDETPKDEGTGARSGPPPAGKPMRRALPAGWARLLGIGASLALFAVAAIALVRVFSQLDFAELRAAIAATSGERILEALGFTALSYFALTGYDVSAVRQVAARAPYRIAALASFASYALSFNLGFPVVTGAAVRFWIYSRVGVTARQVANITIITGVTFWLGMVVMLGAGLIAGAAHLPEVDRLPPFVNFLLGACVLAGTVYYLVWVSLERRGLTLRGHWFELPGPGLTLTQMALGVADLCCAAAALYVLMPSESGLDFMAFVAVYVVACILGVVSHSPGGIGVFEATILHAVPSHSPESVLAALLLFRAIYYLLPFVLALAALGAHEGFRRGSGLREAIAKMLESREL